MRIITICSDGEIVLQQQAQWSGYKDMGSINSFNQLVQDLQFFVRSLSGVKIENFNILRPTQASKQVLTEQLQLDQSKMVKVRTKEEIKKQIDALLDEINKLI